MLLNGSPHRSVVKKDNLAVESAGICLAGTDRNFDLQSLVCVIRTGQNQRRIVRVGDNRRVMMVIPKKLNRQLNDEYDDDD